jgi:hypothetical protein
MNTDMTLLDFAETQDLNNIRPIPLIRPVCDHLEKAKYEMD